MSAQNPTPDDLRTIADNLQAEGYTSRAEVIRSAAKRMEVLEMGANKLAPAFAKQADELAGQRAVIAAAREYLVATPFVEGPKRNLLIVALAKLAAALAAEGSE